MKDHIRDYATEAFRFYARCGKPSYDELKARIVTEAYETSKREIVHSGNVAKPTEFAVINAQNALDERQGELLDILAVERVMKIVDAEMRKVLDIVYFTDPDQDLQKGDVSARVHKAELEIPASEHTIYRRLAKARELFAAERGLRFRYKIPEKLAVQRACQGV